MGFSLTITDRATRSVFLLCALLFGIFTSAVCTADNSFSFVYLSQANDPFYKQKRAYTGLSLRNRNRPIDGVKLALKGSRIIGRTIGVKFELVEVVLDREEDARSVVEDLISSTGAAVFLLDLPMAAVSDLGAAFTNKDVLLFNIRHSNDSLRGKLCSPVLFHTIPSYSMLMDALAQFLRKKNWQNVLLLEGQENEDTILSKAFQTSVRKFRLGLVDVRSFVLSNDPRERGQTNIPILTRGTDYDVVFLADALGEFGRYVPYNTQQARPIVGTEGLKANTWHWTLERFGAPQLNQRFNRFADRQMKNLDYAAWAAVRAVLEAILRTETTDAIAIKTFLSSDALTLDTYKGLPGSFRPWDNQLRQPILLSTFNAVVAIAPIDGFLHEKNNLDTLGIDHSETECTM